MCTLALEKESSFSRLENYWSINKCLLNTSVLCSEHNGPGYEIRSPLRISVGEVLLAYTTVHMKWRAAWTFIIEYIVFAQLHLRKEPFWNRGAWRQIESNNIPESLKKEGVVLNTFKDENLSNHLSLSKVFFVPQSGLQPNSVDTARFKCVDP